MPMKPLSATQVKALLERFDHAKDAVIHEIRIQSPSQILLVFGVQDKQRGYDWIDLLIEVDGIEKARLPENAQLADMEEGISILFEEGQWGIGIGDYHRLPALEDSNMFLIGTHIKWSEASFSG